MGHRFVSSCTLTVGLLAGVTLVAHQPVLAQIDRSGQRCFTVGGDQGDAAIVNLTPILAEEPGNGQLISFDVRADPPVASNANFGPGTVDPNAAVTPIGRFGRVCFQNSVHSPVGLVADHLGTIDAWAYTPATASGAPSRPIDTRDGLGGDVIAPSGQLCFDVHGNPGDAAIVNLTPVLAGAPGDGQLISSDVKADPPVASNTNFGPGTVDPNVAVTTIGGDGQVCFQNSVHTSVHLVADHLGTIAASAYTPAQSSGAPSRRVDTRTGLGGGAIAPAGQLCFDVSGNPGDAAIVNLTPILAGAAGDGQLISSDVKANPPVASNTNFRPGSVDPNVAVTRIGADGQVCFQNSVHTSVHLVADHLGSIAASAYTPATPSGAPDRRVDTRTDIEDARPECIDTKTTNYDTATARTMFGLSSRAYEIDPGAPSGRRLDSFGTGVDFAAQMSCWVLIEAIRGAHGSPLTDTELIVARNTSTNDLAVAFRGTEANLWDILNDLDARREPWTLPNERRDRVSDAVHSGFADAYRAARSQLAAILTAEQRSANPDARVYFTGHSLGGALATLASIDLVDDLIEVGYRREEVVTYTFGAPRSLSRTMAGHHATYVPNSHAVANPMDPITHVPVVVGSDHYSHLRNMTALHAYLGQPEVRVDRGDGRNYRGCVATTPLTPADALVRFATYHARTEYNRRLASSTFVGTPTVWITTYHDINPLDGPELRMHWDAGVEGPCDQAALWNRSSRPTSVSDAIRDRWVAQDSNDQHTTTVNADDANWIGYVSMFDEVIVAEAF